MKRSQANNDYFDAALQLKDKSMRAVCFSPDKHSHMKSKLESSSPLKISNYHVKRNRYTDQDEVHINKRTKLSDPNKSEITFDFTEITEEEQEDIESTDSIQEIIANENAKSKVNITGRVTLIELPTTITSNGKTLTKQECTLTDETGSMRLVLWEEDIKRIQSGNTYKFCKAIVRSYQKQKYITLNKQTSIHSSTTQVRREDAITNDNFQNTVTCPAEAGERLTTYLSCTKCNSSLPSNDAGKIIRCSNCGMAKLKTKCKNRALAKVLFVTADQLDVTLTIFDDKLSVLYAIYKQQSGQDKEFSQLTEEDLTEMLLSVNATITYSQNNRVLAIS